MRSREDIDDAISVASAVGGVKSVTNEMQLTSTLTALLATFHGLRDTRSRRGDPS